MLHNTALKHYQLSWWVDVPLPLRPPAIISANETIKRRTTNAVTTRCIVFWNPEGSPAAVNGNIAYPTALSQFITAKR